ncbi:Fasciclin-like arabinogalactan protein [Trichoderma ghanense]|uniref:Fasciclin-like arabinogalactan protein n=1 Tax=Trichoderma ghanense TaxID=65468 RepID=A0ABY2HA43_9HYPO
MRKQYIASLFCLTIASVVLAQSPQSLLSVLEANGFTEFAQRLQASEPVALRPGIVVYAPSNNAFTTSSSGNLTVARRADDAVKRRNAASYAFGDVTYPTHVSSSGSNNTLFSVVGKRGTDLGAVYETLYQDPSVRLGAGHNQTLVQRNVPSASLPFVFTGLGKYVRVTGDDIPFDHGVVRPVDGLLTLPRNLSTTLQSLGESKFEAALQSAGLVSALQNTASITVLAPSDSVFNLASTLSKTQLAQVIKEHVIVSSGLPVYSPWLENGQVFHTLGGTNITVVVKDNVAYLNGARILGGDSVIENGVVHTIDKLLSRSIPTVPTNAAIMTRLLSWETLTCSFFGTIAAAHFLL